MELHSLRPAKGSVKKGKRIARGEGSGHGGTSTKGHKGDKARTGHKNKRGHEGGQMPIQMRLPKRGFKNINRVEYVAMNISRLQEIADKEGITTIDIAYLTQSGILKLSDKVKILAKGELTSKLTITAHACSDSAKIAIESAGGNLTIIK
jgi:large subunit ribosomal protein L15